MNLDLAKLDEWFELRWGLSPIALIGRSEVRDLTEEELEVVTRYQDFALKLTPTQLHIDMILSMILILDDEVIDCFRGVLPLDAESEATTNVFQKIRELKDTFSNLGAIVA